MPTKEPEKRPAKVEIDALTLRNQRLEAQLKIAQDELKFAKEKLLDIEAGYKARVSNSLKMDIQSILQCSDTELMKLTADKSIDELEQMVSHLVLVKGDAKPKTKFKPIVVAGAGTIQNTRSTVGCLFGKSAKEIREMAGDM